MNFVNYVATPILYSIYERLVLKHQCGGFYLIKKASLTASRPLTVLERDPDISQHRYFSVDFVKLFGKLFAEHVLATTSYMMLFFSFFADQ